MTMRTVVAGFGNVLRGDDGFGVEVIRRLEPAVAHRPDVSLCDIGTGGIHLAQELLEPARRLIIVDAMTRGQRPGTVYLLRVESIEAAADIDLHLAVPSRALAVAQALGALPPDVWMIGCEPEQTEELHIGLTPAVAAAVDHAVTHVTRLLALPGTRPIEGAPVHA